MGLHTSVSEDMQSDTEIAVRRRGGDKPDMEQVGPRLRARALELQLSDAEVARRAGLLPTRYGHYVSGYREPDLATLVRICRVLALRPDALLGYEEPAGPDGDGLKERRGRLAAFAAVMDEATLDLALAVMQALAATPGLRSTDPGSFGLPRLASPVEPAGPGETAPVSPGPPGRARPRRPSG